MAFPHGSVLNLFQAASLISASSTKLVKVWLVRSARDSQLLLRILAKRLSESGQF